MKRKQIFFVFLFAAFLTLGIDFLTNHIDTINLSWDFKYYLDMTFNGFNAQPLVSPFAYRYPTPFLAALIIKLFSVSVYTSYRIISYAGCILQFSAVFLFVQYLTRSFKAGMVCMVIVAFTFMNVKFLLFDVYRPDHFAYFFIAAAMYFALREKFYLMLITVMIGVQFREFVIAPLLAFMLNIIVTKNKQQFLKYIIPALAGVLICVLLPRLLIPVTASRQYVGYGSVSDPEFLKHLFNPKRIFNFIYSVVAYFLPVLILITKDRVRFIKKILPQKSISLLFCYLIFILILSFIGGTDLTRFVTYLFIIQVLFVGLIVERVNVRELIYLFIALFLFNRIWMNIPQDNISAYLDFYPGYSNHITVATIERCGEIILMMAGAMFFRHRKLFSEIV